ncbi:inorganic phosphate transporter [Namhaeicola litoreus]|uniref:Phosphate transporter n=1 Tax=Namhaeicola litoreus TaxID=1052145 RepID=A0ABW3Y364_9FLAO
MFLFFLTSGLFLGWTLGANDASNVFGSAVGSKMIKFRDAAIVASIFVVLGSVLQGFGGAETLGKLGAVDAIGGAFTVSLCAGLTVYWMTKAKLPVSTSQAIVGGIIGWNYYTHNPIETSELIKIVSTWFTAPILGGIFAVLLYLITKKVLQKSKIHIIRLDAFIKFGLFIVGAFGSFSLGANNIANVVGVFVPSLPKLTFDFGFFTLNSIQVLFLLGGLSIAAGIITYSKKVMQTVGSSLMKLNSETALIVVLAHSLVLFVFSSPWLSQLVTYIGLPPIPLVPVSSSQAIVGAIIGIGLLKGGRNIQANVIGKIFVGWILTPLIAGFLTFVALFVMSNVFKIQVTSGVRLENLSNKELSAFQQNFDKVDLSQPIFWIITTVLIILVVYLFIRLIRQNNKVKEENFIRQMEKYDLQQKTLENEIRLKELVTEDLIKENERKNVAQRSLALNIVKKNDLLKKLKSILLDIDKDMLSEQSKIKIEKMDEIIHKVLDSKQDRALLQKYLTETEDEFYQKLDQKYSGLTEFEKRIASLIRSNYKLADIATIVNSTREEVKEVIKILKKRMNVLKGEKLNKVLKNI